MTSLSIIIGIPFSAAAAATAGTLNFTTNVLEVCTLDIAQPADAKELIYSDTANTTNIPAAFVKVYNNAGKSRKIIFDSKSTVSGFKDDSAGSTSFSTPLTINDLNLGYKVVDTSLSSSVIDIDAAGFYSISQSSPNANALTISKKYAVVGMIDRSLKLKEGTTTATIVIRADCT